MKSEFLPIKKYDLNAEYDSWVLRNQLMIMSKYTLYSIHYTYDKITNENKPIQFSRHWYIANKD